MNIVLRAPAGYRIQRLRVHKGLLPALLEWVPHCQEGRAAARTA